MDVELPDGTVIEGVPEGTTKAQLIAKLKAGGYDVAPLTSSIFKTKEMPTTGEEALSNLLDVGTLMGGGAALAARAYAKPVMEGRPLEPVAEVARGAVALPMMAGQAALGDVAAQQQLRELPANIAESYRQGYGSPEQAYRTAVMQPGRFATDVAGLPSMAGLASAPIRLAAGNVGAIATPIVRNVLNPKARLYGQAFGPEMPSAINALATARPGLTSTQALADVNAPLAQAVSEQLIPQVPQQTRAALQAQEASRASRIGEIAGTPEELAAAKAARDAEATANYSAAFKQVMTETPELTAIMDRPSMEKAFGRASQIAEERGQPFRIGKTKPAEITESKILDEFGRPVQKITPAEIAKYPVRSLHYVKMAMDDMIRSPEDFGIGAAEVSAIRDTRKEFISQLEKNENYAKARATYAAQSQPINKMQIAQELQKSLTSPLTGETTRGAMFARAAEEAPRTIKRATGQEFFTKLEDVLDPSEVKIVDDIRDEFRRTQLAKDQAKLAEASAKDLASQPISPVTGIKWLNTVWTIANSVVRRSLGKIDEKLATEIGLEMLEPAQMKKALQAAQEYNAKTQELQRAAKRPPEIAPSALLTGAAVGRNVMAPQQNQNAMAR